jgi:3-oxoacyl-[acyl-carrier protein] reductase
MSLSSLSERVVIVTGAAAGIGRAIARRFAKEGCHVAAWDLNDADKTQIRSELRQEENRGLFRKTNVADASDVETAVSEVIGRWGRIDVLINNAGIVRDDQLVKWKVGEVAKIIGRRGF